MNREQAKQLLPIIQAFADGETIQFKDEFGKWFDVAPWTEPMFRGETEYRIKPKPLERWLVVNCDGDTFTKKTKDEAESLAYEMNNGGGARPYRVAHMVENV